MANTAEVKMYSTPWCPYCIRAKQLLKRKGIEFEDFNVAFDSDMRSKLLQQTGSRTVPQIFINGSSVGGCDELYGLDAQGKLDQLLAQAPA